MATMSALRRKARRVGELLAAEYGRPSFAPRTDETPVDQLVRTVLSQKTTSEACRAAFENLREACGGSWEAAIASIARAGLA